MARAFCLRAAVCVLLWRRWESRRLPGQCSLSSTPSAPSRVRVLQDGRSPRGPSATRSVLSMANKAQDLLQKQCAIEAAERDRCGLFLRVLRLWRWQEQAAAVDCACADAFRAASAHRRLLKHRSKLAPLPLWQVGAQPHRGRRVGGAPPGARPHRHARPVQVLPAARQVRCAAPRRGAALCWCRGGGRGQARRAGLRPQRSPTPLIIVPRPRPLLCSDGAGHTRFLVRGRSGTSPSMLLQEAVAETAAACRAGGVPPATVEVVADGVMEW